MDDRVLDRFEFRVVHQRKTLRQLLRVGSDDFIFLFVPQLIERGNPLVGGKLRDDSVHEGLEVWLQISELLLSARL